MRLGLGGVNFLPDPSGDVRMHQGFERFSLLLVGENNLSNPIPIDRAILLKNFAAPTLDQSIADVGSLQCLMSQSVSANDASAMLGKLGGDAAFAATHAANEANYEFCPHTHSTNRAK